MPSLPSILETVRSVHHRRSAPVTSGAESLSLFERLRDAFDAPFAVLSLGTGELNHVAAQWLHVDLNPWIPLLEEVARRGKPEILDDVAPLSLLAVPLLAGDDQVCDQVAVATLLTDPIAEPRSALAAAAAFGIDVDTLVRWSKTQRPWSPRAIEHLSGAIVGQFVAEMQNRRLKHQLTNVSRHLLQTFDELNLLHRINERLSLEIDERQLLDLAIGWLSRVLPAECLLACVESDETVTSESRPTTREWIYAGSLPLPTEELDGFFARLGPDARNSTVLVNSESTSCPTWPYETVREAISVPIRAGAEVLGWLMAINHRPDAGRADEEFGNLETSLLSSVASMLGMHSGNVRLYKDQSDFFDSVVRALSSAIDAKDPYTRGHSDRVARIAVQIARHLKCTTDEVNCIYLSGLLHDIGKIGIDDGILRKSGPLTPEEMEHIQLHPELGHRILQGVRQLEHVLPVVLHHHESWDGTGYPGKLVGEEIPWLARIVAVADSFDAMSSDRPYRAGMPKEQLDAVFREGSGKQWDPAVVTAFFEVRDAIDDIVANDRDQLDLDIGSWSGRQSVSRSLE